MGADTDISWARSTFNPWWGCTHAGGPGCDNCYAEALAKRYGHEVWGHEVPRRLMSEHYWGDPLRWERRAATEQASGGGPWRVFCASMADVFERVPGEVGELLDAQRARLWGLIERTPHLTWMLLTKRPENVERMVPYTWTCGDPAHRHSAGCFLWCAEKRWPANVWVGTTTENQAWADVRVPRLLRVPAPVRFISYEPAVGPLVLRPEWLPPTLEPGRRGGLEWVITGGESGPRARPAHPAWFRGVRDQCVEAGVPFHLKQWGEYRYVEEAHRAGLLTEPELDRWPNRKWECLDYDGTFRGDAVPGPDGACVQRVGKRDAGRELDGRAWAQFPDTQGAKA